MSRTAWLTQALLLASCASFAVQFRVENYAVPWPSADGISAPSAWSTLLDASTPLRLNPPAFAWQSPDFSTNGVAIVHLHWMAILVFTILGLPLRT